MRERKLIHWALLASLVAHLGFMIYSGHVRVNIGPRGESLELFQISFVDSVAAAEFTSRAIRQDRTPPDSEEALRDPTLLPQPSRLDAAADPRMAPNLPGPAPAPSPENLLEPPGAPLPVMTAEGRAADALLQALAGEPAGNPEDRVTQVAESGPRVVVAPQSGPPPPPAAHTALTGIGVTSLGGPQSGAPPQPDALKIEPPRIRPPLEERPSLAPAEIAAIDQRNYEDIEAYLDFKLETYHAPGGQGYFRVTITPNSKALELPVLRKDIVFCLDASRSIGPITFRQLQNGLTHVIARLRPEDRFNLIGFDVRDTRLVDGLTPATPQAKQDAIRLLGRLRSEGLTNIYSALVPISQIGGGLNHPFVVLLFSDGRPNRGVLDSSTIINDMTEGIKVNSSIFALGLGQRTNQYLLDLITMRNKGRSYFAPAPAEVDYQVRQLYNRVADPLMINVDYRLGSDMDAEALPRRLPDLYRNGDLVLLGRIGAEKSVSLYISGQFTDTRRHALFTRDYPARDNGGPEIEKQYAYYRMYRIIEQICQEGQTPELLEQLDRVSQYHGIPKPYYSNVP